MPPHGELKIARILEAQIIEGQINSKTGKQKFKYYVTFLDENRRMDRWLTDDEVIVDT